MEYREGIYDMDDKTYRAIPHMLNYSSIPHLLQSPAHYISNLSEPRSPSKEMTFGTATHLYILEPDKFKEEFVVQTIDARTVKGKAALLDIEFVQKKNVISEEDFLRIKYMNANVKKHAVANKLLQEGKPEQVMLYKLQTSEGEIWCKSKVDYLREGVLIDIKTTKNSDTQTFSKSIENFNYFIQGAMYSRGHEIVTGRSCDFVFIAIESVAPYAVNVIKLSENHNALGYKKVYEAAEIYAKCLKTNVWPSYPEKVQESVMSKWLR